MGSLQNELRTPRHEKLFAHCENLVLPPEALLVTKRRSLAHALWSLQLPDPMDGVTAVDLHGEADRLVVMCSTNHALESNVTQRAWCFDFSW